MRQRPSDEDPLGPQGPRDARGIHRSHRPARSRPRSGMTLREPYGVIARDRPVQHADRDGEQQGRRTRSPRATPSWSSRPSRPASAILRFAELVNEVLPPGTVNIVSGLGDVGDALVRHVDVAKVTMTGSSATAKLIQAAGAETLTPAIFELGGKSPNIVLDDADLDIAAIGLTLRVDLRLQRRPGVRRRFADPRAAPGVRGGARADRGDREVDRGRRPDRPGHHDGPADLAAAVRQGRRVHRGRQAGDRAALRRPPRRRARARPARRLLGRADAVPRQGQLAAHLPGGDLRPGRRRHPVRHRRRGDRAGQRQPLRPRLGRVEHGHDPGPPLHPRDPVGQRLGEHVPADPPRDPLRRDQGERLRPRRSRRVQPREGRGDRAPVGRSRRARRRSTASSTDGPACSWCKASRSVRPLILLDVDGVLNISQPVPGDGCSARCCSWPVAAARR